MRVPVLVPPLVIAVAAAEYRRGTASGSSSIAVLQGGAQEVCDREGLAKRRPGATHEPETREAGVHVGRCDGKWRRVGTSDGVFNKARSGRHEQATTT